MRLRETVRVLPHLDAVDRGFLHWGLGKHDEKQQNSGH